MAAETEVALRCHRAARSLARKNSRSSTRAFRSEAAGFGREPNGSLKNLGDRSKSAMWQSVAPPSDFRVEEFFAQGLDHGEVLLAQYGVGVIAIVRTA
jgi:hypothetical protein